MTRAAGDRPTPLPVGRSAVRRANSPFRRLSLFSKPHSSPWCSPYSQWCVVTESRAGGTPAAPSHRGLCSWPVPCILHVNSLRTAHSQALFPWCQGQGMKRRTDGTQGANTEDACLSTVVICGSPHTPSLGYRVPEFKYTGCQANTSTMQLKDDFL